MSELPPFPRARRQIARRIGIQAVVLAVITAVAVVGLVVGGVLDAGQGAVTGVLIWLSLLVAVAPLAAFRTDTPDLGPTYGPDYDQEKPWR